MQNIKKIFTYLVVGALVIALSISCKSNEDPGSGPLEVSEESGNSKDIMITNSDSVTKVSTAGTVGFTVNGSTSYTISIESVSGSSSTSLPSLEASDFLYTESTKKLTLSDKGLKKVYGKVNNMEKAKPYEYTITFKVVDSSDTSKEKTIDVKVNLYRATKLGMRAIVNMFSDMSKFTVSDTEFGSFNKYAFNDDEPNFSVTGCYKATTDGQATPVSLSISAVSKEMVEKLTETDKYKRYFSGYNFNKEKEKVSDDKRSLTLYIKFTLKVGYVLENAAVSIKLTLEEGQTWVE